jgi:hypothetical protein
MSTHGDVTSMAIRQPRYSKEEFAQRGEAIYESAVRSQVEADNHGKIVAITYGRLRQRLPLSFGMDSIGR